MAMATVEPAHHPEQEQEEPAGGSLWCSYIAAVESYEARVVGNPHDATTAELRRALEKQEAIFRRRRGNPFFFAERLAMAARLAGSFRRPNERGELGTLLNEMVYEVAPALKPAVAEPRPLYPNSDLENALRDLRSASACLSDFVTVTSEDRFTDVTYASWEAEHCRLGCLTEQIERSVAEARRSYFGGGGGDDEDAERKEAGELDGPEIARRAVEVLEDASILIGEGAPRVSAAARNRLADAIAALKVDLDAPETAVAA
jgi:hypothetical protein